MRKRTGKKDVDTDKADQWASAATTQPAGTDAPALKPWQEPHVRADLKRDALVPLPEDYYLALQWLREQRVIESQRGLIREAALAEIDRLVEHATGEPVRKPENQG